MIIDRTDIFEKIFTEFGYIPSLQIADRNYATVTIRSVERVSAYTRQHTPPYGPKFDCDDFALTLHADVVVAHARTRNKAEAAAFGEMFYTTSKNTGHAINLFIIGNGRIVFFEPQTGREIKLTDEEINSIVHIRM